MIRSAISDIRQGLLRIIEDDSDIRIDSILIDVDKLENLLNEKKTSLNMAISDLQEINI